MSLTIENQIVPRYPELEWLWALWRAKMPQQKPPTVRTRDDRTTPETIPPERLQLASAEIRHLSDIIRQLVELREEQESDEYGTLPATTEAFQKSYELVTAAAIIAARTEQQIPRGCASTDSEGGVRIEWVRPNSSVHLVIPPAANREAYIYHEVGNEYATDPASAEELAHWLCQID